MNTLLETYFVYSYHYTGLWIDTDLYDGVIDMDGLWIDTTVGKIDTIIIFKKKKKRRQSSLIRNFQSTIKDKRKVSRKKFRKTKGFIKPDEGLWIDTDMGDNKKDGGEEIVENTIKLENALWIDTNANEDIPDEIIFMDKDWLLINNHVK
mgnify:CR=1 FL=1